MTRRERGTGTEGARRRPWPPLVLATAVVAAVVALLAGVGAAAGTVTGTRERPGREARGHRHRDGTDQASSAAEPDADGLRHSDLAATPTVTAPATPAAPPHPLRPRRRRLPARVRVARRAPVVPGDILESRARLHPDGPPVALLGFVEEVWDGSQCGLSPAALRAAARASGQPVFCGATIRQPRSSSGSTRARIRRRRGRLGLPRPAGTVTALGLAVGHEPPRRGRWPAGRGGDRGPRRSGARSPQASRRRQQAAPVGSSSSTTTGCSAADADYSVQDALDRPRRGPGAGLRRRIPGGADHRGSITCRGTSARRSRGLPRPAPSALDDLDAHGSPSSSNRTSRDSTAPPCASPRTTWRSGPGPPGAARHHRRPPDPAPSRCTTPRSRWLRSGPGRVWQHNLFRRNTLGVELGDSASRQSGRPQLLPRQQVCRRQPAIRAEERPHRQQHHLPDRHHHLRDRVDLRRNRRRDGGPQRRRR